jgi:hypothetical protein
MVSPIEFSEIEESLSPVDFNADSAAPHLAEATLTLRCRLLTTDPDSLEALRFARRAMLREEWTRGLAEDEPSLEDAVFSAFDVAWTVRAAEAEAVRSKLAELAERANRARMDATAHR